MRAPLPQKRTHMHARIHAHIQSHTLAYTHIKTNAHTLDCVHHCHKKKYSACLYPTRTMTHIYTHCSPVCQSAGDLNQTRRPACLRVAATIAMHSPCRLHCHCQMCRRLEVQMLKLHWQRHSLAWSMQKEWQIDVVAAVAVPPPHVAVAAAGATVACSAASVAPAPASAAAFQQEPVGPHKGKWFVATKLWFVVLPNMLPLHTHTFTHTHGRMHAHTHSHSHVRTHTHINKYTHMQTHTHTCANAYAYSGTQPGTWTDLLLQGRRLATQGCCRYHRLGCWNTPGRGDRQLLLLLGHMWGHRKGCRHA